MLTYAVIYLTLGLLARRGANGGRVATQVDMSHCATCETQPPLAQPWRATLGKLR